MNRRAFLALAILPAAALAEKLPPVPPIPPPQRPPKPAPPPPPPPKKVPPAGDVVINLNGKRLITMNRVSFCVVPGIA